MSALTGVALRSNTGHYEAIETSGPEQLTGMIKKDPQKTSYAARDALAEKVKGASEAGFKGVVVGATERAPWDRSKRKGLLTRICDYVKGYAFSTKPPVKVDEYSRI